MSIETFYSHIFDYKIYFTIFQNKLQIAPFICIQTGLYLNNYASLSRHHAMQFAICFTWLQNFTLKCTKILQLLGFPSHSTVDQGISGSVIRSFRGLGLSPGRKQFLCFLSVTMTGCLSWIGNYVESAATDFLRLQSERKKICG